VASKAAPVRATRPAATRPARVAVPRWLLVTSLSLCLLGLGMAGYLSYEHHTASTTLSCPDTGAINCVKVTTSSYSRFLGLPVSDLGLAFFAAMTALCLPAAWRSDLPALRLARLGVATGGVGFVLYLVWAELFQIDAICLWCTGVHVVTAALFAVIAVGTALFPASTPSSA
jgi:uncharacterized membrane protein